mgnify:CR=1 FL=1
MIVKSEVKTSFFKNGFLHYCSFLKDMIKSAPSEVLTTEELKSLMNSDVGEILSGKNKKQILNKMILQFCKKAKEFKEAGFDLEMYKETFDFEKVESFKN